MKNQTALKPTTSERKKYVLKEKRDFDILALCNELEEKKLSKQHRKLVKLIKSQLEEDWRTPLLQSLKELGK